MPVEHCAARRRADGAIKDDRPLFFDSEPVFASRRSLFDPCAFHTAAVASRELGQWALGGGLLCFMLLAHCQAQAGLYRAQGQAQGKALALVTCAQASLARRARAACFPSGLLRSCTPLALPPPLANNARAAAGSGKASSPAVQSNIHCIGCCPIC